MSVSRMFTPDRLPLQDAARLHLEAILREQPGARKRWLLQKFFREGMERIRDMRQAEIAGRRKRMVQADVRRG